MMLDGEERAWRWMERGEERCEFWRREGGYVRRATSARVSFGVLWVELPPISLGAA